MNVTTKEETYQAILADIKIIWTVTKTAAIAWKKIPTQKLTTASLPICAAINETINHAEKLQKNTDPQTRIILEEIKERLTILKQELIKNERTKSINNATDLLNTCRTTLQGITILAIEKTESAKTIYSQLAA